MDPLYMRQILHGEISLKKKNSQLQKDTPKSQYELEIDKEIDDYVDHMELDLDPKKLALKSEKMQKAALKQELKEAIKLPEMSQQMKLAKKILKSEAKNYLSEESLQILNSDLATASERLAEIKIDEGGDSNIQNLIKMSDTSVDSIAQIAQEKYKEERLEECLSLFYLLTILNPENDEFWFRLGIIAQQCEKYELALRAYAVTFDLDPENLAAKLFSAECYIGLNRTDEALQEIEAVKKLAESEA